MDTKEFLTAILPPQGDYYVLGGQKGLTSQVVSNIDEALADIATRKANDQNVYISVSSHTHNTSRKAEDVTYKKAYYLDIDCGPTKDYEDQKDALNAVRTFLSKSMFLPPSILVSSGRGLHLYWVLSECIGAHAWQSTAGRFKQFVSEAGLNADPAVTSDSARIMRVPGTLNYRGDSTSECRVLKNWGHTYTAEQFSTAIPGEPEPIVTTPSNVVALFPGDDGFESMVTPVASAPRRIAHVLPSCATLDHIHKSGGAEADFNLWFRTLNFLAFCEDGDDYVHHMSSEHPGYSEAETQRQWEKIKADKASGKLSGATTCESFHDCAPESCGSCPHWKERAENTWKSPIHHGLPQTATTGLPWPWQNMPHGNMGKPDGDNGLKVRLTCRVTNPLPLESEGVSYIQFDFTDNGRTKTAVSIDMATIQSETMLPKEMSNKGCILKKSEYRYFGELMTDWYRQLASATGSRPALEQYGWTTFNDRRGFAVGDRVYWSDNTSDQTSPPDPQICAQYTPCGSIDRWKEIVAAALRAKHIETEVVMAAAFAAPLVKFTGESGCIISAVSPESGTGKSLALRLSQSVWGNPSELFSMNDTVNAVGKRMGIGNNLPAYWDEIRIVDEKASKGFINFVYQCTQGREKKRMEHTTALRKSYEWCTMLVCAGNSGIQERMAHEDNHTNAGLMRVLEFNVDLLNPKLVHESSIFAELSSNHGTIGVEYAKYLATNRKQLAKAVVSMKDRINKKFNAKPEARFLVASMATLIVGATIAKNKGWVDFDMAGIKEKLFSEFKALMVTNAMAADKRQGDRSAVQRTNDFLRAHTENTTITNFVTAKSGGLKVSSKPMNNKSALIRMGTDDKTILIHKRAFTNWVYENMGSAVPVLSDLAKMGVTSRTGRLMSGISGVVNPAFQVLVIPYNRQTADLFSFDGGGV